ncbi:universal stress protein UspA [Methylacidiphilum sp. Yel]|uniref:universal stress protein n=1 Tax=Methylacidiphilum sp. Yel TaxID=1847730 RepID=UPI00106B618A|nr:universal stress protein [Methylacidiphilum sp. Yel]TFE69670.1 universal stress protein UspA [Methylacidiphilum sp. Yel]
MISKILLFENVPFSLRMAALLASKLRAELLGLFIEDLNLLRLSSLPCAFEIEIHSALTRSLEPESLLRRFRTMANQMEQQLEAIAKELNIPWSFQTTRGFLWRELIEAAKNCDLIILSQKGPFSNFQSFYEDPLFQLLEEAKKPVLFLPSDKPLEPPFGVLINPTKDFLPILTFAANLAKKFNGSLTLFVCNGTLSSAQKNYVEELASDMAQLSVIEGLGKDPMALASTIAEEKIGLLIFSMTGIDLKKATLKALLRKLHCPVLLSP